MLFLLVMIIVLPILFLIFIGSLVVFMSWLYLRGLSKARDPAARVTPRSPWEYFDSIFRFKLKLDKEERTVTKNIVLLMAPVAAVVFFAYKKLPMAEWQKNLDVIFDIAFYVIAGAVVINIFCSIWAPFCYQIWTLSTLVIMSILPTYVFLTLIMVYMPGLPGGLKFIGENKAMSLMIFNIAVNYLLWRWQRRNDRWFRFEN